MTRTPRIAITLCTLLLLSGMARAQSSPTQLTVPFSDPARPGTVKVNVLSGSISVTVGSGREVVVTTTRGGRERDAQRERDRAAARERRGAPVDDDPSAAGLRRLTPPAGVTADEDNNVVTISSPMLGGAVHLAIQVPRTTSVVLRAVNGGDVSVEGIGGSIEVNNVNGSIRLADVAGPVIAHATNGGVTATLREVAAGKPMAFTSFNGNVDVTLPASAKANLKLRSDRGDVYTDFDVQPTPGAPRSQPPDAGDDGRARRGDRTPDPTDTAKYRMLPDRSIYGTVNGGGPDFELRTFNGNVYLRKGK